MNTQPHRLDTTRRALLLAGLPACLVGCAALPETTAPPVAQGEAQPPASATADGGAAARSMPPQTGQAAAPPGMGSAPTLPPAQTWQAVTLPGKRATRYAPGRRDGRSIVHARADGSASMWRCQTRIAPAALGMLRFSWRVDALNLEASVADVEREDAVARLVFAFDGDRARLSPRTRAMFDLAQALTGEAPPFATLMYVWETTAPVSSVIANPRTDRIRKIVVDSGAAQLGRWREHRRDLGADYQLAFGEPPGALLGVALMTDSDNTQGRAEAWYGPVSFEPPTGARWSRGRMA